MSINAYKTPSTSHTFWQGISNKELSYQSLKKHIFWLRWIRLKTWKKKLLVDDSWYDIPLHQYLMWFGSKFNEFFFLNNQSEQIPSNEFISESTGFILNSIIFFYLVMMTIKNNMGQQWVSHLFAAMDDYLFTLLALISILNSYLGSLTFLWFGLVKNNYCVLLPIWTCVESKSKYSQ